MPSTPIASPFTRLPDARPELRFSFEGRSLSARQGDTLAAALLAAGVGHFRATPVSASPRAPWCMMGVCFDCLVEIDGVASRQACMIAVAEGMRVRRQHGAKAL
jgi:predicted molibdopterin-dependent oxidoreductase YjgC